MNMERFDKTPASYNYCGICGDAPGGDDEPNRAPIRWWDPDEGWQIGTLCRNCFEYFGDNKPKEGDFAYNRTNGVCDNENTDEDASEAFPPV
jgi:hypothetical protein